MKVLGIESSCDECAAGVVEDGRRVLSNVVATQIPFHAPFYGVVPEIASRKHTEWIDGVVREALEQAGLGPGDIQGVAATAHPGLLGSLLVGLSFAKAFAWARDIPFIAVDHMLAHLYASNLVLAGSTGDIQEPREPPPAYPFLGLLVSGGHSIICLAEDFDDITVLGTTVDDAVGEAFDKVARFYGFGYPGGPAIEALAREGDPEAFHFPLPNLYKKDRFGREHRYDFSYSGLKTAVINQLEQFARRGLVPPGAGREAGVPSWTKACDIAASFQRTGVEILVRGLLRAVDDTGIKTIVAGGGVAANARLRARLAEREDLRCVFPPLELCGDNGAMTAGLGFRYLARGEYSPFSMGASARVRDFKRRYPG
jgi:N6-L-threonylcarbamoyladenine synthase